MHSYEPAELLFHWNTESAFIQHHFLLSIYQEELAPSIACNMDHPIFQAVQKSHDNSSFLPPNWWVQKDPLRSSWNWHQHTSI